MDVRNTIQIGNRRQQPSVSAGNIPPADRVVVELGKAVKETIVNRCFMRTTVVAAVARWSLDSVRKVAETPEVGGLLLGYPVEVSAGRYDVYVDTFAPFEQTDFQSSVLLKVSRAIPLAYESGTAEWSDQLIVGWFHTHPGHGPYLSNTDLKSTHLPFFSHPYQLAIVLDPLTTGLDTGVFTRRPDNTMNRGEDAGAMLSWSELLPTQNATS